MPVFTEGNLRINFPIQPVKFDDPTSHGLTNCMKAVDFIVEEDDRILLIELKDPEDPKSSQVEKSKWIKKFLNGEIDEDLKYKCRDSFLYKWASDQIGKPFYYLVLVAIDSLTPADLLGRTDELKRKLPIEGPTGIWQRKFVNSCTVFNIQEWNKHLPAYHISRI